MKKIGEENSESRGLAGESEGMMGNCTLVKQARMMNTCRQAMEANQPGKSRHFAQLCA